MKRLKTKIIVLISIFLIVVASITTIVFAAFTKTSTRGDIEVSADTLTASTSYTSKQEEYDWTYTKAGDTKEIEISTKNESDFILHRYYVIEKNTNKTNDDNLLSAIMVYYNDKYIGQLIDVIENQIEIYDEYVFVEKTKTKTDSLKFELHQAASNSIFDSKDISINITTYTENANYLNNIFVSTEDEFKHAVDDINSGLFENIPKIVLCNTLTLNNSYTILNPACIYLNGSTLNGSLELNDTDALLEVLGDGTFNVDVTLTKYDSDKAKELVINNIKDSIGYGLEAGTSKNVLGHYGFYDFTIAASQTVAYTKPNVVAPTAQNNLYSKAGQITVEGEKVSFKVLGSKTALLDNTLKHLPADGSVLTTDLFLPTYIPSENAVITWLSSNENVLSSDGKIAARRIDSEDVSLYAEIKVNDTVITRTYTFKVSAHNNEINFYKLVQEISPIVINNIYSSSDDSDNALYHLPIVSQNNDGTFNTYDYRTAYDSPTETKLFNWEAYRDIGLESITYSMTTEQVTAYEYITLSGNELYLNTTTLNNYARINITGDFGNDETYTTTIHISIAVGTDTQLLEKAFTQVSEELSEISVLGNILKTRKDDGMKNEKGDFSLSSVYLEDSDYTIEFSGAKDIIASITKDATEDKYNFAINPEYFNEYETTVAFTATVYYKKGTTYEKSKSRTFYVVVPAALHVKDFTTISIYNATKYQVFNQLRDFEKGGETGYSISGTTLSDSNLDYILLRDIVGDETYITEYKANDYYLEVAELTSSTYALGVKTLNYNVNNSNDSAATDTAAYDFIKLIQWATSEGRVAASTVVSNTAALGTLGSTKSNNEDYLNNDEIAVLKAAYKYYTGASDDDWNNVYNEVLGQAPGYIYTNPELLNTVISSLQNNSISFTSENFSTLFGKYMEILQRYAVSTTKVNANDVAPCQQQYNSKYVWYISSTQTSRFSLKNNNGQTYNFNSNYSVKLVNNTYWQRASWPSSGAGGSGGDGNLTGFYATKEFAADRTLYITAAELQVLEMFWLNACGNNLDTAFTATNTNNISSVLTNDGGTYYSKYKISDFDTIGKGLLNAFNACMEIPTYFSTDGVAKLIKLFYENYNKTGKYELSTYDGTAKDFKSIVNGSIPYVTNLDNLKSVLSYFVNLEELYINGSLNLSAFLSENGISTVFARTSLFNKKIERLTMKYSAHSNVYFDLSNIKNFENLKYLDLSNNKGIQSVNELVNVNRKQYIIVDIKNIGIDYEYQEFALDNIATSTCTVYYTDSTDNNREKSSNDSSRASNLADLSDFNKFISKYMYMTNVIYNEDGSTTTINWRIDDGNEINGDRIVNGGNYPEIDSVSAMNKFISPYYYCDNDFLYGSGSSAISFTKNHLYEVYYENSTIKATDLGFYNSVDDLENVNISLLGTITEPSAVSSYTPIVSESLVKNTTTAGTVSYSDRVDWVTNGKQTGIQVSDTLEVDLYNNPNSLDSLRQNTLTLPTSDEVVQMLNNKYGYELYNLNYSVSISIQTKNYNKYNNGAYTEAWQQGLFDGDTLLSYSDSLLYGQDTYNFGNYNQNYLGHTFKVKYYNIKNDYKRYWYGLYPYYERFYDSPGWGMWIGQSFYKVTMTVTYTGTYDRTTNITINYKNGTQDIITSAYACGWRIKKSEGATIEYTDTQSVSKVSFITSSEVQYIYYDGDNTTITDINGNNVSYKKGTLLYVVPYYTYKANSRSRTRRVVGTVYTWEFWYVDAEWAYTNLINGWGTTIYTYDGELIDNIIVNSTTYNGSTLDAEVASKYTNSITTTYISGYDVDWNTVPLTSTWEINLNFYDYISYVETVNNNAHSKLNNQDYYFSTISSGKDVVFLYSGVTGTENIYKKSLTGTSTTYTNGYGYTLSINNKMLYWTVKSALSNPTGTTMDSILAEANQHFGDNQYGYYYGRYYGYSGNNIYTSTGNYYKQYYIYRIMPNTSNTAFEWQEVQQYVSGKTPSQMLLDLGTGVSSVDDIYYAQGSNAFSDFFSQGWYKIIVDEKTNIVNLVKFNDMGISITDTYTQLINDKLVARSGDYLGYSGTFNVQISALIRVEKADGSYTEYIKTYKMKFVGSLTS